jgi:hypothetical protein
LIIAFVENNIYFLTSVSSYMDQNIFILVIKIYVIWILIDTIFFKKIKSFFLFLIFIYKWIFFLFNYFFKFVFFPFIIFLSKLIFKKNSCIEHVENRLDETINLKDGFPPLIVVDNDTYKYSYVKRTKQTTKVYYEIK